MDLKLFDEKSLIPKKLLLLKKYSDFAALVVRSFVH